MNDEELRDAWRSGELRVAGCDSDCCPRCGRELAEKWSGVECPQCHYAFCY